MSSYLDFEGLYDPKKTFAVTNWSEEEIVVNWKDDNGDNLYTLHSGEVKVYPQYLAYFITKALVDREMYRDASKIAMNPDGSYSKARERAEMAVSNKDLRKPYEDKTIQEVREGEESPVVTAMRAQIRKELIIERGLTSEMNNEVDGSEKEFASVPKKAGRPKKAEEAAAGA